MRYGRLQRHLERYPASMVVMTAAPPFERIEFKPQEVLKLPTVTNLFAGPWIGNFVHQEMMWLDLPKEDYEDVIKGPGGRQRRAIQGRRGTQEGPRPCPPQGWADCSLAGLRPAPRPAESHGPYAEIAEEKAQILGYDSAGEDRREALYDALIERDRRRIRSSMHLIRSSPGRRQG